VLGVSDKREDECEVTREELREVWEPYDVVKPYETWESASSFVVQEIVAVAWVTEDEVTLEMIGGVVSEAGMLREQEALVPPFVPLQDQRY